MSAPDIISLSLIAVDNPNMRSSKDLIQKLHSKGFFKFSLKKVYKKTISHLANDVLIFVMVWVYQVQEFESFSSPFLLLYFNPY